MSNFLSHEVTYTIASIVQKLLFLKKEGKSTAPLNQSHLIFSPWFLIAKSMQISSGIFPHFVLFLVYENG